MWSPTHVQVTGKRQETVRAANTSNGDAGSRGRWFKPNQMYRKPITDSQWKLGYVYPLVCRWSKPCNLVTLTKENT